MLLNILPVLLHLILPDERTPTRVSFVISMNTIRNLMKLVHPFLPK